MIATLAKVLPDACRDLPPVRVGRVPSAAGTADRYAVVQDDAGRFILRVDLYAFDAGSSAFEEALLWQGNLVVGFGYQVYAIATEDRSLVIVELGDGFAYFGYLYPTRDYLLIATGERLLRMEPDRSILWQTDVLAVDGVVVHDPGPPIIRGEAEHDPPDGWAPFAVSAADGCDRLHLLPSKSGHGGASGDV